jgi:hypothetical protein
MNVINIFIILSITFSSVVCQTRFTKVIDFENRPQGSKEILKYQDKFFIHHRGICVDEDQNLLEVCSGILSIDGEANIHENLLLRRFSSGSESMVLDTKNNQLYFSGEENFKNDYPNAFTVNRINIENLSFIDSYTLHDGRTEKRIYYQTISTMFNEKLIVGGTTNELSNQSSEGLTFIIDQNKIDTFLPIDFAVGNTIWSSYVDLNNLLTLSILVKENALNEKVHILKYDKYFNLVWHWISELTRSTQSPHVCELENGNIVVALADKTFNKIVKLQCVRYDQSIAWEFKFLDNTTKISKSLYAMKRLRNGDFIAIGTYGNSIISVGTKISSVPYIIRMTSTGKLLWEKAFYRERPVLDHCSGAFEDVEETINGDLIAVGVLDNYLEYDPISMQGRSDPDILIVRMDAKGCVDDECKMLTKIIPDTISSTHNTPLPYEEAVLFPNPSYGTIEVLNSKAVFKISIFNLHGILVKEKCNLENEKMSISELQSGLYIAHVIFKSGKMVKQKIILH